MKRLTAIALAVLLISCNYAYAGYDYTIFNDSENIYRLVEYKQVDIAYVDTENYIANDQLAFTHKYSTGTATSSIRSSLQIIRYTSMNAYPIWYITIRYNGSKAINADSVTFELAGETYTFYGLYDKNDIGEGTDSSPLQTLYIKLGADNAEFMGAVETYILSCTDSLENFNGFGDIKINMTLHGTEDITTELPWTFALDFFFIECAYVVDGDFVNYLAQAINPTMLVSSQSSVEMFKTKNVMLNALDFTLNLPEDCYLYSQRIKNYGTGDREVLTFLIETGTERYKTARITLEDLFTESGSTGTRNEFNTQNADNARDEIVLSQVSNTDIQYITIGGVEFAAYPNVTSQSATSLYGIVSGYGIYMYYEGSIDTINSDPCFDKLVSIATEIVTELLQAKYLNSSK